MPRAIRNNQPHAQNDLDTLQGYAAEKLRIALDPKPVVRLDADTRAFIDAAAVVLCGCATYAPRATETLRAFLRGVLRAQLEQRI